MLEKDYQRNFVKKVKQIKWLDTACVQNEVGVNNVKLGSFWKSMGKMRGFSDLIIFDKKHKEIIFVEMKGYKIGKKGQYIGKGKQSEEQIIFQELIEDFGFKYFLVDCPDTESLFFDYVLKKSQTEA